MKIGKTQISGEQRSARASVQTPALLRAGKHEGVFPPAAGWRCGVVEGPPGGGVGGSGGEGRLPSGRRVAGWVGHGEEGRFAPGRREAGWGGSGGEGRLAPGRREAGAAPPPPNKAAAQSSFLRTENELFSY